MTDAQILLADLDRTGLPAQVAQRVEAMIMDGSLRPGDRLPAERVLAEQLGVARPVLREAIRLLEGRGLLRRRQGSGTWVQELAVDLVQQQLRRGYQLLAVPAAMAKMYELRLSIEPTIAGLAAQRATDAQVAQLQELSLAMTHSWAEVAAFIAADQAFHVALWEAAGNEYFGLLLQPVQETLATYMHDVLEAADEERLRSIAQRHEQIVDALRRRDSSAASAAMHQHFSDDRVDLTDRAGGGR